MMTIETDISSRYDLIQSACFPLFLGNKRRKKPQEVEKSIEEGSDQLPVTS